MFVAGVVSGLIAGVLFPVLEVLPYFATGGWFSLHDLVSLVPSLGVIPLGLLLVLFIIGFLLYCVMYGGLGALLGFGFAKLESKLPIAPVLSAPAFAVLISLILCVPVFLSEVLLQGVWQVLHRQSWIREDETQPASNHNGDANVLLRCKPQKCFEVA